MNNILKIRAHHLLCMQGFQGYGYSEDFTTNMAQVIEDLKSPNRQVKIIAECDIICARCPHNKEYVCGKNTDSAVKINDMDTKVLKRLGLKKGEIIKAKDILPTIKAKLKISDVEDICGDCSWKAKCLFAISYENL